ncbi:MAG: YbaB/EbfC family nucleoid-associated protein [Calditrichaeota bacterium]|nr:YbaB/EbfC family nucleoid-associated protein [Calditrichota bacterium]
MKNLGIMGMLKQFQEVQEEMNRIKQELASQRVTASAGGGMVEVTANGRQKIIDIKIEPELLETNDREMLEDLIVAAVNLALEKASDLASEEMNKIAGGVLNNLPEGLKIPGFNA